MTSRREPSNGAWTAANRQLDGLTPLTRPGTSSYLPAPLPRIRSTLPELPGSGSGDPQFERHSFIIYGSGSQEYCLRYDPLPNSVLVIVGDRALAPDEFYVDDGTVILTSYHDPGLPVSISYQHVGERSGCNGWWGAGFRVITVNVTTGDLVSGRTNSLNLSSEQNWPVSAWRYGNYDPTYNSGSASFPMLMLRQPALSLGLAVAQNNEAISTLSWNTNEPPPQREVEYSYMRSSTFSGHLGRFTTDANGDPGVPYDGEVYSINRHGVFGTFMGDRYWGRGVYRIKNGSYYREEYRHEMGTINTDGTISPPFFSTTNLRSEIPFYNPNDSPRMYWTMGGRRFMLIWKPGGWFPPSKQIQYVTFEETSTGFRELASSYYPNADNDIWYENDWWWSGLQCKVQQMSSGWYPTLPPGLSSWWYKGLLETLPDGSVVATYLPEDPPLTGPYSELREPRQQYVGSDGNRAFAVLGPGGTDANTVAGSDLKIYLVEFDRTRWHGFRVLYPVADLPPYEKNNRQFRNAVAYTSADGQGTVNVGFIIGANGDTRERLMVWSSTSGRWRRLDDDDELRNSSATDAWSIGSIRGSPDWMARRSGTTHHIYYAGG